MKFYGKTSLSSVLKVTLNILIAVGLITFLIVFVTAVKDTKGYIFNFRTILTGILYLFGGFSLLIILFNLRIIMNSLVNGNPFVSANVKSLFKMSICCFIITFCYVVNFIINKQYIDFKFIYIDTTGIHTDIEFLIFFFAGCFILILSKVFQQAIAVKEEHDFTI